MRKIYNNVNTHCPQVEKLADHVQFDKMKKNPMANPTANLVLPPGKTDFMRRGVVGDWVNHFTTEQSAQWDQWIEENIAGTDLQTAVVFKQDKQC